MAKTSTVQIKLVSSADTGYFYVTKKNPRTKTNKLELKKFDPVARKHVVFKEAKIKYAPPSLRGFRRCWIDRLSSVMPGLVPGICVDRPGSSPAVTPDSTVILFAAG